MPDSQLQEIEEEDEQVRSEAYKQYLDGGLNKDEAIIKLRKGFPTYERYKPGDMHTSQDSNLPYELSPRINRFFNSLDKLQVYKSDIENSSSMNAFIRAMVKKGII